MYGPDQTVVVATWPIELGGRVSSAGQSTAPR
jgi:hypothetical protein